LSTTAGLGGITGGQATSATRSRTDVAEDFAILLSLGMGSRPDVEGAPPLRRRSGLEFCLTRRRAVSRQIKPANVGPDRSQALGNSGNLGSGDARPLFGGDAGDPVVGRVSAPTDNRSAS
jgi:hypothetical protein